jgi:hypothetical protein
VQEARFKKQEGRGEKQQARVTRKEARVKRQEEAAGGEFIEIFDFQGVAGNNDIDLRSCGNTIHIARTISSATPLPLSSSPNVPRRDVV